MIRVLHVVGSMNKGGIETLLMTLYRNINRDKFQFDFAVHSTNKGDFEDEIKSMGGKIYRITPRSQGLKMNRRDWENVFRSNPEIRIIHQHVSSLTYITPLKVASKYNIKVRIIHSHSAGAEGYSHYLLHSLNSRSLHKYANFYLSCSNKASEWLFGKSHKILLKNVILFRNVIDASSFTLNEEVGIKIKQQLNIEGKKVIGHVGRFTEAKNHEFILDIFYEALKLTKNIQLILVGHGSLEVEIKNKIKELGIVENVTIINGKTNNVNKIYQTFDVFLFPSKVEGLGMALIEAQAAGIRSLASKEVPEEVNITNLVEFVSLNNSAEYWAKLIIDNINYPKRDTLSVIESNGYDINTGTNFLENLYEQFLRSEDY